MSVERFTCIREVLLLECVLLPLLSVLVQGLLCIPSFKACVLGQLAWIVCMLDGYLRASLVCNAARLALSCEIVMRHET